MQGKEGKKLLSAEHVSGYTI